jgi:Fe-S-cluster-containing dehydrogenase component
MDLHRRDFFKIMGATGLTLAVGKDLIAAPKSKSDPEFRGILYDAARCKGCRGCEIDCADANGLPEPPSNKEIKGLRKPDDKHRTVVNEYKTSKGVVYSKMQCMHCNEPSCAAVCLTQAMTKTKDGPVIWRADKCMGCRYCMVSCPFDIPKFEFHSPNPKIEKCTMCYETRVKKGELPACVENCPNEALMFGTRRELITEARRRMYEKPDLYYDQMYGEHEAGGTCWLYLSPVPFKEIGLNTTLQTESYPSLTKGFLYTVPSVFVLVPALLLGIQQSTKKDNLNNESENE